MVVRSKMEGLHNVGQITGRQVPVNGVVAGRAEPELCPITGHDALAQPGESGAMDVEAMDGRPIAHPGEEITDVLKVAQGVAQARLLGGTQPIGGASSQQRHRPPGGVLGPSAGAASPL